jgi:putative ABC transport system ATP-binding protein
VLSDLDLDVGPGEIIAVQGPSGAGKSTLLAALCGLVGSDNGRLWVKGERLDGRSDRIRSATRLAAFGLVFQADELLPELTLAENVTLPLRMGRGAKATSGYDHVCGQVLMSLGIGTLAARMPSEVSGGQLQRAAIARAVIHAPAIILADEPTASLDAEAARSAMALLINAARQRNAAVVIVTHDDVIAHFCDRRLVLEGGKLVSSEIAGQFR